MGPLLSVTEQLEIIREVRKGFNEFIDTKSNTGLCLLIHRSLLRKNGENYDFHIPHYIPEFTYENAVKHCGATELNTSNPYEYYWWEVEDFKSRLKFLDWLEEDLLK